MSPKFMGGLQIPPNQNRGNMQKTEFKSKDGSSFTLSGQRLTWVDSEYPKDIVAYVKLTNLREALQARRDSAEARVSTLYSPLFLIGETSHEVAIYSGQLEIGCKTFSRVHTKKILKAAKYQPAQRTAKKITAVKKAA